jgi:hypothetical protein
MTNLKREIDAKHVRRKSPSLKREQQVSIR